MQAIHDRVRRIEDRLERLLAGGWRNAAADLAELTGEAAALEEAGLPHLAGALRSVATAPGASAALPAITLASAHCRLLRARLGDDAPPPGAWAPLPPPARARETAGPKLLPIARMALGDGEAWACVGLRGTYPTGLTLVVPPEGATRAPWFRQLFQGRQRWLARHPVGAAGSVEVVAVADLEWVPEEPDQGEDLLAGFLQAWDRGSLKENQPVFRYGGALMVKQLTPDDLPACAFPDPAQADLLRSVMNGGPVWTVAWTEGALLTPLAVLHPGGKLWGKPALTHLARENQKEIF